MQYLCLASPDCTYTQYEEADREIYRELLQFACNCTSLFEWWTKMTAHQEARNKAGLPLQQSKITCIPGARGTEDTTRLLGCCRGSWSELERHWATSTSHTCESRRWDPCASAQQYWRHNRSFPSAVICVLLASYFISPTYYIMSGGILFLKHLYCIEIFWGVLWGFFRVFRWFFFFFFILTLFSIATNSSACSHHIDVKDTHVQ